MNRKKRKVKGNRESKAKQCKVSHNEIYAFQPGMFFKRTELFGIQEKLMR